MKKYIQPTMAILACKRLNILAGSIPVEDGTTEEQKAKFMEFEIED